MASQTAEFFCGVIFKVIVARWQPFRGFTQPGSHSTLATRESLRHNRFSKEFAGIAVCPTILNEPGSASALQRPASATCRAKILLRKARQYMGHTVTCQGD